MDAAPKVPSLLAEVDLKSADLARELEVSDGHIADLKSGRRRLTLPLASRLEKLTGKPFVEAVVKEAAA
jgi:plasmid maintenance system antidote protein VapI